MANIYVNNNIDSIKNWITKIIICFSILEVIFYPQKENIYGCFILLVGWILLSVFVYKQTYITNFFLPFIGLFGLGLSFYFLPLVITFIEGKPLTFRFSNPILTFNNQLLNVLMLICAFRFSSKLYHEGNLLQRLWSKMGYFTVPTDAQIWTLGISGVISRVFLLTIMGTDDANAENLGFFGHLMNVTSSFVGFPVLLLFKNFYGGNNQYKVSKMAIFFYMIIVALIGLATGKRQIMFLPFMTFLICLLLPYLTENKNMVGSKVIIVGLIVVYLVTGPIANLAIAMAVGRDDSMGTSSKDTFKNIWDIYTDKETLHNLYQLYVAQHDNGGDNTAAWSEYYVDNIILDRFCNLRVCDATLSYVNKLGYDNPTMHEYLENQVLFLLPTPVLQALDNNINKFELQYTPGDLISTNGLHLKNQYHGYRVAGDTGIGLYLWGYMYYIYAFFIFSAFFYFLASRIKVDKGGYIIYPLPVIAGMFAFIWSFNNATGIVGVISKLLRTGWQEIVVYCLIYFIIRKLIK